MTPPWTLESLAYHWGDAFLFSYARDRWVALRRDKRSFLTADTLDELEAAIRSDYGRNPVPRDCDPPIEADYPDESGEVAEWGWEEYGDLDEADGGKDQALDPEMQTILRDLRQLFPFWLITYSPQLGAWVAKSQYGTICENSATFVRIALARIEQRRGGRD